MLASPTMRALGRGIATTSFRHRTTLEVWYRDLSLDELPGEPMTVAVDRDADRYVRFEAVETRIDLDAPPSGAADAYLRLHLLSARLVRPRELNVDGIFGQLPLVAWTDLGAVHPADLDELRARRRLAGQNLIVHGIDKFPRMTDFVSPSGVRIADASRVRLGAHLAEGTVVMQEGFVNFNAGTLGPSMVEGRITAGSLVDADSDIGAGSSILGSLSGGGSHIQRHAGDTAGRQRRQGHRAERHARHLVPPPQRPRQCRGGAMEIEHLRRTQPAIAPVMGGAPSTGQAPTATEQLGPHRRN
jgi:2,3,4,5-tetrahydropyridine-2-carboxylate N-succinyltransferase